MPEEQSVKVQLGCGTLILIALIVMMFSGGTKVNDLRRDVQQLTKQVVELQAKVDALSKSIQTMRQPEAEQIRKPGFGYSQN